MLSSQLTDSHSQWDANRACGFQSSRHHYFYSFSFTLVKSSPSPFANQLHIMFAVYILYDTESIVSPYVKTIRLSSPIGLLI